MAPSNGSRCHPSQTGLVSRWPVNSRWGPLLPLSTSHNVFRRPSNVFSHQTLPTPSDLSFASRSRASVSSLPFVLSMRTMSCVRPIEVSAANDAPTFSNTKAFIFFLLTFPYAQTDNNSGLHECAHRLTVFRLPDGQPRAPPDSSLRWRRDPRHPPRRQSADRRGRRSRCPSSRRDRGSRPARPRLSQRRRADRRGRAGRRRGGGHAAARGEQKKERGDGGGFMGIWRPPAEGSAPRRNRRLQPSARGG